jgi:2-oxo-4-hydroxy-4-carboxy-5-ureidoimidazoline decarboxylase
MESWQWLDRAPDADARTWLTTCCGSSRWVTRMCTRRPFGSQAALLQAARDEWFALSPADWQEAFAHHPKLGDGQSRQMNRLSASEQSRVTSAPASVLDALADGNRRYEAKFGYIFIACAAGQPAEALLARLEARLGNDPQTEQRVAAEEQAKITALRLESSRPPI